MHDHRNTKNKEFKSLRLVFPFDIMQNKEFKSLILWLITILVPEVQVEYLFSPYTI